MPCSAAIPIGRHAVDGLKHWYKLYVVEAQGSTQDLLRLARADHIAEVDGDLGASFSQESIWGSTECSRSLGQAS